MARHFYNLEVVTPGLLDEDEVEELEAVIRVVCGRETRISTEYVDSEG